MGLSAQKKSARLCTTDPRAREPESPSRTRRTPASPPGVRAARANRAVGRLGAAALAVLALAALALAVPERAQAQTTLVSNTEHTSTGSGYTVSPTHIRAQRFMTGNNESGYTLSSVQVYLADFGGTDAVRVSIYEANSSGNPVSSGYALTRTDPVVNESFNTFTAPSGSTLAKGEMYFVVVEATSGSFTAGATSSDNEDSDKESEEWSIHDSHHRKSGTNPWGTLPPSLRIKVTGAAKTDTTAQTVVSVAGPSLAASGGHVFEDEAHDHDNYAVCPAPAGSSWVLTRTGSTADELEVKVTVSESGGDFVPSATEGATQTLTFAAGETELIYRPIAGDTTEESHGTVTVTVVAGTGYAVDSGASSATVNVRDDDFRLEFMFQTGDVTVSEDQDVTLPVLLRTTDTTTFTSAEDVPRATYSTQGFYRGCPDDLDVGLVSEEGTALSNTDFIALSSNVRFDRPLSFQADERGGYTMVGPSLVLDIVDEADEVPEPDEYLVVILQRAGGLEFKYVFPRRTGRLPELLDDFRRPVTSISTSGPHYKVVIIEGSGPDIVGHEVISTPRTKVGTKVDTYGVGEAIEIAVTWVEAVTVTGTPELVFELGDDRKKAAYARTDQGGRRAVFSYTVLAADEDTDGIALVDDAKSSDGSRIADSEAKRQKGGSIVLESGDGIVSQSSGADAVLRHRRGGTQSGHKVDGSKTPPANVSVAGPSLAASGGHVFEDEAHDHDNYAVCPAPAGSSWVLTRTGSTADELEVKVTVSESGGDFVPSATEGATQTLTFAAGETELIYRPIAGDTTEESHGTVTVTVTVVAGAGYAVDSGASSATVNVRDDDFRLEFMFQTGDVTVSEDQDVTLPVLLRTTDTTTFTSAEDVPRATYSTQGFYRGCPDDLDVGLVSEEGTALSNTDFIALSSNVRFDRPLSFQADERGGYTMVGPSLVLDIVDEADEVPEPDEYLVVILQRASGLEFKYVFPRRAGRLPELLDDFRRPVTSISTSGPHYKVVIIEGSGPDIVGHEVISTPRTKVGTKVDTYGVGEAIEIAVTWVEAVTVTGTPELVFELGDDRKKAAYARTDQGGRRAVFSYTVLAADEDTDGIALVDDAKSSDGSRIADSEAKRQKGGSIVLETGDGIVSQSSGADAVLRHRRRGTQSGHKVDGSKTPPANALPVAAASAVTMLVDWSWTFAVDDFGFSDTDSGDMLARVIVTSLPTAGELLYGAAALASGDLPRTVTAADVASGLLVFTPAAGATGSPYATFDFKVHDGKQASTAAVKMTMNVTPPPTLKFVGTGVGVEAAERHEVCIDLRDTANHVVDAIVGFAVGIAVTDPPGPLSFDKSTWEIEFDQGESQACVEVTWSDPNDYRSETVEFTVTLQADTATPIRYQLPTPPEKKYTIGDSDQYMHSPENLTAVLGSGEAMLTWDAAPDDAFFQTTQYRYSTDGGTTWESWTAIANSGSDDNPTSYTVTGLSGTSFLFELRREADGLYNAGPHPQALAVPPPGPGIDSVAVTSTPRADKTYAPGEVIEFTVTFDEAVTVTGAPHLVFSIANPGQRREVNTAFDPARSSATDLVFRYTVLTTDEDTDGIEILHDVVFGGGSIVLDAGESIVSQANARAASMAHSDVGRWLEHKVDGTLPPAVVPGVDTAFVNGAELVLAFDRSLDESSAPAPGAFAVRVLAYDTADTNFAREAVAVIGVSVAGREVRLVLAKAVSAGDDVLLDYTAPAGAGAIRSAARVAARSFRHLRAVNATAPSGALPVTVTGQAPAAREGQPFTLTVERAGTLNTRLTVVLFIHDTEGVTGAGIGGPRAVLLDTGEASGTVTVTPGDDGDMLAERALRVHTVLGGDPDESRFALTSPAYQYFPVLDVQARRPPVLSVVSLALAEGASRSYTVALGEAPQAPQAPVAVQVTGVPAWLAVTDENGADLTASDAELIFTAANWQAAQTVRIEALEDDDAADGAASLMHLATGPGYVSGIALAVTVDDDDTAGLVISPRALTVVEEEAGASFTVALESAPVAPLRVSVTAPADSGLELNPHRLVFHAGNWSKAQAVQVSAAHDTDADTDTATVTVTAQGSGEYADLVRTIAVTVTDNDVRGIRLSAVTLDVTEGATATYTVRLNTPPVGGDVRVSVTGVSGSDVTVTGPGSVDLGAGGVLTFTAQDWETEQRVTVAAAPDADAADDMVTLTHRASGAGYGSAPARAVAVTVADTQSAALVVAGAPVTVEENGASPGEFTVALSNEPVAPVTVRVAVPAGTDVRVAPLVVRFTRSDWDGPKTFEVRAGDDEDTQPDAVTLSLTATGSAEYAALAPAEVEVEVRDDDTPGLKVSVQALRVAEQGSGSFTVALNTRPSGAVSVSVSGVSGTDLTVTGPGDVDLGAGGVLTFTVTDWSAAQTVTVAAGRDDDAADDVATLTLAASGADYAAAPAAEVTVTVADDETAALVVSADALEIDEGRVRDFTVEVATRPSAPVTVTVTVPSGVGADIGMQDRVQSAGGGSTVAVVGSVELRFTPDDWDVAQSVRVVASGDGAADGDVTGTLAVRAAGAAEYAGLEASVTVTAVDVQKPELHLRKDRLAVGEGPAGTATYRIRLHRAPAGGDVQVTVTGHAGTDVRVSRTSRRFTPDDWGEYQAFEVTAVDDADALADPEVTLALAATGSAEYAALAPVEVAVTVEENDTPSLDVSVSELEVAEDGSRRFTVRLNTQPSGDVTVRVTGVSGSDLTVTGPGNADLGAGGVLTFTDVNWNRAQTVTVAASSDADAADDEETLTLAASGADYGQAPSKAVAVTVDDDDTPALVLSETALAVTEQEPAVSFTVKLASEPTAPVTVTVDGHAGNDLDVTGTALVFHSRNWDEAQTVTVAALEDSDANDERVTLELTAAGAAEYAALPASQVAVTVTDNDVPGIRLSATALEVAEGGTTSYRVSLTVQPTGTVRVRVTGMSGTDLTVTGPGDVDLGQSGAGLTFTDTSWDVEQTVTVAAGADADAAADEATLRHRASGADYGSAPARELVVTVDDDDTAALVLSATALVVQELGPAVSLRVRLASEPLAPVTVTVTGHAGTDVRVSPSSLRFTARDWKTAKTVSVTAVDDADALADPEVTLMLAATGSAEYAALVPVEVAVTVEENDTPSLDVSATQLEVAEGGSRRFTVRLNTQPSGDVTVRVTGVSGSDLTVTGPANVDLGTGGVLTFTDVNWNRAQTVTVAAASDADAAADEETLTLAAAGADYGQAPAATVAVTVADDDTPALVLSKTALAVTEQEPAVSFTVKLASEPTAPVTVTVDGHAGSDLDVTGTALAFDSGNWDEAQTVTVAALEDSDANDERVTLELTAAGAAEYAALAASQVAVTVTDNDVPGIRLSATALEVAEGGTTSYRVSLTVQPTGTVTVRVTGMSGTDLTVTGPGDVDLGTGGVLTFTDTSWDVEQTVTVAAGADADADDDEATLRHRASGADYGSAPARTLVVTVADDDTAALVLSATALVVQELGPAVSLRVRLASEPLAPVTVTVTGHAGTDVRVSPSSLRFTRGNWGDYQAFEVTAIDDVDALADPEVTLMLAATGSAEYAALVPVKVAVTVEENDTPSLDVSATQLKMSEGGSRRFTVRLNTQPSGDVTVRVTGVAGTDLTVTGPANADLGAGGVLTFTDTSWNRPQTVTVAAAADADAAADEETLTLAASGADYDQAPSKAVAVTVADEDTPRLVLSKNAREGLTVQEGGNPARSFTVKLASEPTAPVLVRVAGAAGSTLRSDPPTFFFTDEDWDAPQSVDVQAGDDGNATHDETALLLTPEGAPEYEALDQVRVAVTVEDDELPGIRLFPARLSVDEGERSHYGVSLTTQPVGEVQVRVTGMAGTDLTAKIVNGRDLASGGVLVFTPGNWSKRQWVEVEAAEDADADDDIVTLAMTAGGGYPAPPQELVVTVTDVTPPNTAPTASNSVVETVENTDYTFAADDFEYDDADGDALASVKVTSLPGKGTLKYDGTALTTSRPAADGDRDRARRGQAGLRPALDRLRRGLRELPVPGERRRCGQHRRGHHDHRRDDRDHRLRARHRHRVPHRGRRLRDGEHRYRNRYRLLGSAAGGRQDLPIRRQRRRHQRRHPAGPASGSARFDGKRDRQ